VSHFGGSRRHEAYLFSTELKFLKLFSLDFLSTFVDARLIVSSSNVGRTYATDAATVGTRYADDLYLVRTMHHFVGRGKQT